MNEQLGFSVDFNNSTWRVQLDLKEISTSKTFYSHLDKALVKNLGEEAAQRAREVFRNKYNAAGILSMGEKENNYWVLFAFPGDNLVWRWESKDPARHWFENPGLNPVNLAPTRYGSLQDQQLLNKLENFREWSSFSENAQDMLEEVERRFRATLNLWVPTLPEVFPDAQKYPNVEVLFTEFRATEDYFMDVYCKVTKTDNTVEYFVQTFGRDFKPLSERPAPMLRQIIVDLMQDRIKRI